VITIRNGVASAEVPQPKVFDRVVDAKESFVVIIDTTGATAGIDPKYTGGVLVKKKGIVIRVGETVFSRDYLDRASFTVDRDYFRRLIVRPPWIALIATGIFPGVLAALFIQSAAAAALGTLVSRIRGAGWPMIAENL